MDSKEEKKGLRTWIEIDKEAIKHNYKIFRNLISPDCQLMSVVKSNAYGHNLIDFSHEVEGLNVDWLGVDSVLEAFALRKDGIQKPILILGFTLLEKLKEAIENDISITVSSFEALDVLKKVNTKEKAKIHVKVDTGMGRQGFLFQDFEKVLEELKELEKKGFVLVEGLYTHFAAAKNPSFPTHTMNQMKIFDKWTEAFENSGFDLIKHTAASSAALIFPETHSDMVRVGMSFYGLWPSVEVEAYCKDNVDLKPALTWKTIIGEIKNLKKGSRIGYDLIEHLEKDSKVAVCPIGYWHGFPRALSSIGRVLVGGKKARVLGKVSMDMISIDISNIEGVEVGSEVVIIGRQGKEEIFAGDLANLSDTTNYEIITRINPLIKRIFV